MKITLEYQYRQIAKLLWATLSDDEKLELSSQLVAGNSIDWLAWFDCVPKNKLYDSLEQLAEREVRKWQNVD